MSLCIREHPLVLQNFGILEILQWRQKVSAAHEGLDCNFSHMKGIKMFKENFVSTYRFDEFQGRAKIIAKIKSEMTKTKIYDVTLEIDLETNEVIYGACECRVGSNPSSCKHTFALLAFLEDYSAKEMFKAPTEKLQSWHQPCPKKLPPKTASEMFANDKVTEINDVKPVNMQALMKLSKTKQILSAINCDQLFIKNSFPLPAELSDVYQIVFLNEHILGDIHQFIEIENQTIDQTKCDLWHEKCRFRLTASFFHKVLHNRSSIEELCVEIKKRQNQSLSYIPAVEHGTLMEPIIRNKLRGLYNNHLIRKCGLVINPQFPYLGASPDGLMMAEEPRLIEIKTAYNPKGLSLNELCESRSDFCLVKNENEKFELKKSHRYYTQIQGQLGISNLNTCLFILHYSKSENMFIEEIALDRDMWKTMLTKLNEFYFDHYLPHLCSIF